MTPMSIVRGAAAPILKSNINTDIIIPGAYLRSQSADLAHGLFAGWRFDEDGRERTDFVLNQPQYRQTKIILAGPNFGCGSSREAAIWALMRFGISVVLAPSFADIFYENAFRNGVLPGIIDAVAIAEMAELSAANPEFTVDLERKLVLQGNRSWSFDVPESRRNALIRGDDEIGMTLAMEDDISSFHRQDLTNRDWAYRPLSR
jgi:3-isopropylmalate dehydratase small subunit